MIAAFAMLAVFVSLLGCGVPEPKWDECTWPDAVVYNRGQLLCHRNAWGYTESLGERLNALEKKCEGAP